MKISKLAIQSVIHNSYFVTTSIVTLLALILVGSTIMLSKSLYDTYSEAQLLQADVDETQRQVDIVKKNKDLIETNVDEYNAALEKLIPDDESYFLVISALEQLEQQTGITIKEYNIDLAATTQEKLSLTVNTQGDISSIDRFLQNYKFISGRLITNESLIISPQQLESVAFSLNFYHSPYVPGSVQASTLTEADIQYVTDIISEL